MNIKVFPFRHSIFRQAIKGVFLEGGLGDQGDLGPFRISE